MSEETKDKDIVVVSKHDIVDNLAIFISRSFDLKDKLVTIRIQRSGDDVFTIDQIGIQANGKGYGTMNTFKLEE